MKTFLKPLTTQEETFYLRKCRQGDKAARDVLIERNLRLVAHIVKKYQGVDEDLDDLISIGTIGLIKAVDKFDYTKGYTEGLPAFYHFTLDVDQKGDTFLDFEGWGKGCIFLNGFNLGRFWEIGPQKRLYIPAPLLKEGRNEIVVFETDGKQPGTITLKDEPDIG